MRHCWWKRMLLVAAGLVAMAGSRPAWASTCGDLNNSGTITTADAIIDLQVAAGVHPNPGSLCGNLGALQCGDLNASGAITTADVVILLNVVVGNPTTFAPCTGAGPVVACGGTLPKSVSSNRRIQRCDGCENSLDTLSAHCSAFVDGTTFVEPGVTLSIDAGAIVCGKATSSDSSPSILVFRRGTTVPPAPSNTARINAPGTPCNPIIFTSDQPENAKAPAQWGGVVFNGSAPVNCTGGECLAEGLSGVPFGGVNPNDSSGIMRFARSEFGGFILSTDNETNALTYNGLGLLTDFNHVAANYGTDDGNEWFGGTINMKYVVSTGNQDDQLDWQLGYTGAVQFAFAIQNAATVPAGGGVQGFEADNNENNVSLATPRSNPFFCNTTVIGGKGQGDTTAGRFGAQLRRGTAGTIADSIIMDWPDCGANLADTATGDVACAPDLLNVTNNLFFNNGASGTCAATGPGNGVCTGTSWYNGFNTGNLPATTPNAGPNPGITTGAYPTVLNNNFIPTNTTSDTQAANCSTLPQAASHPGFFDPAPYKGAFLPGGTTVNNWLITCPATPACEWVTFDTN